MSEEQDHVATAEPEQATATKTKPDPRTKPRQLPPYNVVLIDDDDHSFEYVIMMMGRLFGHTFTKGFKIAEQVHQSGRAIVLTTSKEHAELKRDQIHGFGADPMIASCQGAMRAVIEPAPESGD